MKYLAKRNTPVSEMRIEQFARMDPSATVMVKSSAVLGRMAQLGRLTQKKEEYEILNNILARSAYEVKQSGKTIKRVPQYIKMSASEVERCFGKRSDKSSMRIGTVVRRSSMRRGRKAEPTKVIG